MIAIQIQNATLRYEDQWVFKGLTLDIPAQRWTCLLGESGVGKSSLLRLVAGLSDPGAAGTITASDQKSLQHRVAYMAQNDLLLPWSSVLNNVLIGPRLRGETSAAQTEKAKDILTKLGLGKVLHHKPKQLSGGMRQRVALARTLLEDKPVVLMDEPFSALDTITKYRLHEVFIEALQNKTVLWVTHDPLEALRIGHHIVILAGSPANITAQIELPSQHRPRDINDPALIKQHQNILDLLLASSIAK